MGLAGQLRFVATQRLLGFAVPENPFPYGTHSESDEVTSWFLETLRNSRRYLEYGAGGSTYQAAKMGIEFITVDSDRYFLTDVREKIRSDGYARAAGQTYHYADIGLTGHWGRPLGLGSPSSRRLEKFRRYSDPPPECFQDGLTPDLILVDGRFRVACALKAMRMLRGKSGWTVAVLDYNDRPQYQAIADFADIDHVVGGRMAVLTSSKAVSAEALDCAIRKYETESE